jgi:acyl-CoA synthetase (AMP-forming)/AMP-acid ligase II
MAVSRYWTESRIEALGLIPSSHAGRANPHGPAEVASLLDDQVAHTPDSVALIGRFGRMSYAELDRGANAAAAAFAALGIGEGDRIAASGANHNELVTAFLASQRLGAIWVGINRALAVPEKKYLVEDCGAALFLCDRATAEEARGWIDAGPLRHVRTLEPGDAGSDFVRALAVHDGAARPDVSIDPWAPAAIAHTSGTTGFPKGVVHSQHNMMVTATISVEHSGDGVPETVRAPRCRSLSSTS